MAFKTTVVQDKPNQYVMPITGSMHCPVRAFLSPELFDITEEQLWHQAYNAASSYPETTAVYLMPDCHFGYHVPVGGVIITDGVIAQAGSGYDISCGMIYLKATGLTAADVASPEQRRAWIEAVERKVATGLGSNRPDEMGKQSTLARIQDVFHYGAQVLGVSPDLCERPFIPVDDTHFKFDRIRRALEKAGPQLGSLGGGNHFIEMQVDPEDSSVWVMVHCGSRGYGWQTAEYYFHRGAELRGIRDQRREESWLRLDEPLGQEFWAHHNSAANYAIANRWAIVEGLKRATMEVFGKTLAPFYEISHNLTQQESITPQGQQGIVHRKGATRALPAGHPDLNRTCWKTTGHPILIPGSMLHGAAILRPTANSWEAGCSVNHGSGRLLGRGQAKRELRVLHDDIDEEMKDYVVCCKDGTEVNGILGNHRRTPLDECGHVYKDLDQVLGVLVDSGVTTIERRLLPVANIKGME